MSRVDGYRRELREAEAVEAYLRDRSGLPGPRANLELVAAAGEELDEPAARRLAAAGDQFLAMCGVVALGRHGALEDVRHAAGDARWRVREAAAMALQRLGDDDPNRLFAVAAEWAGGTPLEARAAAAAVAEPRLLRPAGAPARALEVLDRATETLVRTGDRVLRQGLAYAWSVVVAADLERGRPALERWLAAEEADVRWAMRENLKKARLRRADPEWVERCLG